MPVNTKLVTDRADKIVGAWKKSAATKTFGELTATQYEQLRQSVTTAAATIKTTEAALTEARNDHATALEKLNQASVDVVNGVRGDVSVGGENGSLYEAMGYVRKAERKTGLTRKKTAAAKAA